MILARLKEYWERQESALPKGYQPTYVTKRVVVFGDGRTSIETLSSGSDKGRKGVVINVPQVKRSGDAIKPRLLAENTKYGLGRAGPKDDPGKTAAKHRAFVELARSCAVKTQEPSAIHLAEWLEAGGAASIRDSAEIEDSDELIFQMDETSPIDLPSVRSFWSDRLAPEENAETGWCLVTGEQSVIAEVHPFKVKGVLGGQPQGGDLVSVNNSSGESYGLRRANNSPVGVGAAEAFGNGLNHLLASGTHKLWLGDTTYVYWTKEKSDWDFFGSVNKPTEESVALLLSAAKNGGEIPSIMAPDFFVLALTANSSRIVVRDFHETTLTVIQESLAEWFSGLALQGDDGKPIRPVGVFSLAASLYRDAKDIPKHVPVEIMRSALTGIPLPKHLLSLAVRRNTVMQGPFHEFNKKRLLSHPRMALIKAVIVSHLTDPKENTLTALETQHPDSAYHCGRLLSVLESIQKIAIPGLNATLVDKHFGQASGSPAISFGGLLKDATSAHLPKLRKNRPGAFYALDQRLQEVLGQIGYEFPKSLDFERQGLFALGYYHQRAADFAAARANKELKAIAEQESSDSAATEESE